MAFLINVLDLLALSSFFCLFVAFYGHIRRGGHSYPPGPPSLPIVGNLLDVLNEAPWLAYTDMARKYGSDNILSPPILQS
jgi:hypothetical protein